MCRSSASLSRLVTRTWPTSGSKPPLVRAEGRAVRRVSEGDHKLEAAFAEEGRRYPENIAFHIDYQEPLAHRLYAGTDMLLVGRALRATCGFSTYAMRYGTLPIVRQTGGLSDTVINAGPRTIADRTATGFSFGRAHRMTSAMERALIFSPPAFGVAAASASGYGSGLQLGRERSKISIALPLCHGHSRTECSRRRGDRRETATIAV